MSTNPKELNPIEASKTMIEKSKRSTDRTLRALQQDMEQENTPVLVPSDVATIVCHSNCRADKTDLCLPEWVYGKIQAAGIRLRS